MLDELRALITELASLDSESIYKCTRFLKFNVLLIKKYMYVVSNNTIIITSSLFCFHCPCNRNYINRGHLTNHRIIVLFMVYLNKVGYVR